LVQDALDIDACTNTDFWRKAIEKKEMNNVRIAFKVCEDGVIPVMHKEIRCHLIFDIKSDTLQRKARLGVAGGHMTEPPKDSTYSSVVSRDSVRLLFLIAALNDMDVLACDIQNAYLNAPTKEKVWFRGGKEMGPDKGKVIVIVRALYGLKSSGARFRDHLAQTLRDAAGFTGCKADPDVWLRPAVKVTGEKVYEYALCYVDDVIFQGLDPKNFMSMLSTVYTLKEGSVKEPDNYLGADIRKHALSGGDMAWALSSDTYVKRAVEELERELELAGQSLKKKVLTLLASGYRPELDGSPELDERRSSYYASLMGVLRWCIELGRIDIIVEAGLLSRFQACPREGHLEQMFHVFAYLKKYDRSASVFDWTEPWLDESQFRDCDGKEFYPGAAEAIPSNMPEPRGKSVLTTCFVDADHAGCRLTLRSHSGVLIFVNRAPIIWYSKRQATVESSTFGSELVAMRIAIDLIEGLRYKLRMMGVPIDGSTKVYCDNDTVVKTTARPESTLKKKHNAINYHRAREAQAAGHIQVAWIDGAENLADALTKVIVGKRRHYLLRRILW
jgi:Reverse transcriptase (RNA-dependent DNA polymerase)